MTILIILNSIIVVAVLYHYIFRSKLPDGKYRELQKKHLSLINEYTDFVKEQTNYIDENSKLIIQNLLLKTQQQCNHNYSKVTRFDFTNGNKFNETVIKCNKCNHSIKIN